MFWFSRPGFVFLVFWRIWQRPLFLAFVLWLGSEGEVPHYLANQACYDTYTRMTFSDAASSFYSRLEISWCCSNVLYVVRFFKTSLILCFISDLTFRPFCNIILTLRFHVSETREFVAFSDSVFIISPFNYVLFEIYSIFIRMLHDNGFNSLTREGF